MTRGLWTAAILVCCFCVETTNAQVLIGGGGISFRYRRGPLTIQGSFGRSFFSRHYLPPPVFVRERVIVAQPSVTVVTPPPTRVELVDPRVPEERFGGAPRSDPNRYQRVERVWDTRGVDLDLVTPDRKPRRRTQPPGQNPNENPDGFKLPPGKDVSKPRPPVRPGGEQPGGEQPMPKPRPQPKPKPKRPLTPQEKSDQQIFLGAGVFRSGEYGLALQRFRIATELNPKNADAWFHLAQARFALGQYLLAVEAIHRGMDSWKNYPLAKSNLSRDLYPKKKATLEDQLDQLAKAIKADPNNGDLVFLHAHQLWFDGRQDEALKLFARARTLKRDVRYIDRFFRAKARAPVA